MKKFIGAGICFVAVVITYFLACYKYVSAEEAIMQEYASVSGNDVNSTAEVSTPQEVTPQTELEIVPTAEVHEVHDPGQGIDVVLPIEGIIVNSDKLMEIYYTEYPYYEFDKKNKARIFYTLWEFLVNQNDVDETVASGIIGSVMHEGWFGEREGSTHILTDINDARYRLGKGGCGYGVAQWTTAGRQKNLLYYYELANSFYPNDWERTKVVAECCMLLAEVKAWGVFDDVYANCEIEDAVGRMCIKYEKYSGVQSQWSSVGGYHLIQNSGTGKGRLEYAYGVYNLLGGNTSNDEVDEYSLVREE